MVTFSNPRLRAEFPDWPMGGSKRATCVFQVECHPKRGYRFTRQTTGKAKTHTYGGRAAIVDGSDGRTYLIQFAGAFDFISVSRSDFMCAEEAVLGYHHAVFPRDEKYAELSALIAEANNA